MRPSRGMGDMSKSKMPKGACSGGKMAEGGSTKFIQKAIKKPGALRSALGAKKGETIPANTLANATKAPGKLGQRARFAAMLKSFKKGK